ncbi:NACHT, LRR and PYD domains-containing protein 1a allele 5-like [Engraulis encrasicolus]|uniref:NACHT, LRR and PYD domains-containing protein 1a allele 5-like n=1 Tax=Engraulis encrasicolus TaxID=184585 RepID=UPI002FD1B3F7
MSSPGNQESQPGQEPKGGGQPHSGIEKRPGSPTGSCVSMRSDQSMDEPLKFKGAGPAPQLSGIEKRPGSPTGSCVSMRSDQSMDEPLRFKGAGPTPQLRDPALPRVPARSGQSLDSGVSRAPSMRSDLSKDDPPQMAEEEREQEVGWEQDSDGQAKMLDLSHIFKVLEEKIFTFVKNELQRFKHSFSLDSKENFTKISEDETDAREGVLKMALHFLRKMEYQDLADKLNESNLFPSSLIWITSRPAAVGKIPPQCIDLVTEVQGFNDSQKEEYFRKKINDKSLASGIISHIKSSRILYIMCHIPVFCWIAATVLEIILSSGHTQIPKTLTEMYTFFLTFQTRQKNIKFDNVHDLEPQWNHKLILNLGKLAYKQLEKGNLIFYEDDLRECGIDVKDAAVYSGVCTQIFREESGIFLGTVFSFVHLSIQEYLAALYAFLKMAFGRKDVISTAPQKAESMILLHKSAVDKALDHEDGRFDLFLRFLLGLSLDSNQSLLHGLISRGQVGIKGKIRTALGLAGHQGQLEKWQMDNDQTIRYIKDKIKDVSSSERMINLFHCLNELNDHSLVEEIQRFLNAGNLSEAQLSPGQWSALVFVLLTSDQNLDVFDLKKYVRSDEALLRLMPVVEESHTTLVDSCGLTKTSCKTLASMICKQSSKLRNLDLSGNHIGDGGVKRLCSGLRNPNCSLETLRPSFHCSLII